jgi:hypothetical protein
MGFLCKSLACLSLIDGAEYATYRLGPQQQLGIIIIIRQLVFGAANS